MAAVTREQLQRLPKAELHCHLDGSIRPATLLELGREYGVAMPRDTAESMADYMLVRDADNLEQYLSRFGVTLAVLQTAEALERAAYELAVDAWRDGVRYLEVRYAPVLNVRQGLTLAGAVEGPLRGLATAERELGIMSRVIICGLRHLSPATSMELARLAVDFKDRGVVAFDLAGGEHGNPASRHAAAFAHARDHGLHCTCHAGEGDGAASIRSALHDCGAERVGHATRLFEDPALLSEVKAAGTALEICLTSNVQTRAADSYGTHPLRYYFDEGLNVVLNTDNRLMSGVTLVDEYVTASRELDFSLAELAQIALNGFRSAFVADADKARLLSAAERDVALLLAGR